MIRRRIMLLVFLGGRFAPVWVPHTGTGCGPRTPAQTQKAACAGKDAQLSRNRFEPPGGPARLMSKTWTTSPTTPSRS